jgi:hypothetical protein
MTLTEVQNRAKIMGIELGNKSKAELIQNIQQREGNAPCFGWFNGHCSYRDCCWRSDCLGKTGIIKALHIIEVVE